MNFFLFAELNIIIISLLCFYIYSSNVIKKTHCNMFLVINVVLLALILETSSVINFYLLFELVNITVYAFIGINSFSFKNFKSNIIYFLVGFLGSLIFLIAIFLKTQNYYSLIGDFLIVISLIIKIGGFPFSN